MISPAQLYDKKLIIEYKNYYFGDGLITILRFIVVAVIFAFMSGCISLLMGIKVKDSKVIIITNIMTKTVQLFLFYISLYNHIVVLSLIALASPIFIEGYIYNKLIKEKKLNGYITSIICNIGVVILFYVCGWIYAILNNLLQ